MPRVWSATTRVSMQERCTGGLLFFSCPLVDGHGLQRKDAPLQFCAANCANRSCTGGPLQRDRRLVTAGGVVSATPRVAVALLDSGARRPASVMLLTHWMQVARQLYQS